MRTSEFFRNISIIYWIQAVGLVLFTTVIYFLVDKNGAALNNRLPHYLPEVGIGLLVIISLIMGQYIYNKYLEKPNPSDSLKSKLETYRIALIIKSAMLEFAGLTSGIIFYLNGRLIYLFFIVFLLIIFFLFRPTAMQIVNDLKLNEKEIGMLEDPNGIIE